MVKLKYNLPCEAEADSENTYFDEAKTYTIAGRLKYVRRFRAYDAEAQRGNHGATGEIQCTRKRFFSS
jgi:hypothetical protein